ncbi:hypothetical protein CRG98_012783 [Punica granatum]|uniref:Reverse transcriptase Ty1/copia-type domain-containing protein n=1 Tax=Punica granatum TaxID=22663 RepID=A0A2I0KE32_PUNGR|nr:hypothetical protein CRG98_012783 [Punica granatum]
MSSAAKSEPRVSVPPRPSREDEPGSRSIVDGCPQSLYSLNLLMRCCLVTLLIIVISGYLDVSAFHICVLIPVTNWSLDHSLAFFMSFPFRIGVPISVEFGMTSSGSASAIGTLSFDLSTSFTNSSETTNIPIPPDVLHNIPTTSTTLIDVAPEDIDQSTGMVASVEDTSVPTNPEETVQTSLVPPVPQNTDRMARKHSQWRIAMQEEYQALLQNDTWDLVPPKPTQNIVGCKWMYRIKQKADGTIDRYKARLVAKGFNQREGVDYEETFSPVIKHVTICTILSIAVSLQWPVRKLDVKNAFLHWHLFEEVYMSQPSGFIDPSRPHHVCHLKRFLYGLKQAPRAWFQCLSNFLFKIEFRDSKADSSLFILQHLTYAIFLLDLFPIGENLET